jgi:hypothetical protein
MRLSRSSQEKLQEVLKTQGFRIRYERGNFMGGYCLVMQEKMIIINKFFPLETKINTLIDIIREVEIDEALLSEEQQRLVKRLKAEEA